MEKEKGAKELDEMRAIGLVSYFEKWYVATVLIVAEEWVERSPCIRESWQSSGMFGYEKYLKRRSQTNTLSEYPQRILSMNILDEDLKPHPSLLLTDPTSSLDKFPPWNDVR